MKRIYIVLIEAHTGLGRIARTITNYHYTHIAVCLDKKLNDFVTYSRRRHYVPLDAGFMHEYRDYYAFGKHRRVRVKVFALPVVDSCYQDVIRFISSCENDRDQMFNLFSMMTMPLLHGFRVYKSHNCMSFTAKVIALSGAVKMDRPYYKYSIQDMDALLQRYTCFEGFLRRMDSQGYEAYMKKPPLSEIVQTSAKTVFTLAGRMLRHGGTED